MLFGGYFLLLAAFHFEKFFLVKVSFLLVFIQLWSCSSVCKKASFQPALKQQREKHFIFVY
jgi:hypothetical protein